MWTKEKKMNKVDDQDEDCEEEHIAHYLKSL